MALRALVLNNFRWKLTALMLALVVWFGIRFAMYRGISARNQRLRHQPVYLLKAADDPRLLRVVPSEVEVVVQATKELHSEDVEVFVDVTSMPVDVNSAFKRVSVRGPDLAKVVDVEPSVVQVQRVTPAEASMNNSLRKP